MLDDNIDVDIVRLLAFWYSNQHACIRWHDKVSAFFTLGNEWYKARWSIVAVVFCTLSGICWDKVDSSKIGCNVGGMCINMLAYADDIVLLAHSWRGLQQLLVIVMQQSGVINMSLNPRKSVCVVFLCAIGLKW